MSQSADQEEHPPTDEEMLDLVREAADQLKFLTSRLEAFVGGRTPTDRTRQDDNLGVVPDE